MADASDDLTPKTAREAKIARKIAKNWFAEGVAAEKAVLRPSINSPFDGLKERIARAYPMPTVERPRVAIIAGWNLRVKDGVLQTSGLEGIWSDVWGWSASQTWEQLRDLLNNPTEPVPVEEDD